MGSTQTFVRFAHCGIRVKEADDMTTSRTERSTKEESREDEMSDEAIAVYEGVTQDLAITREPGMVLAEAQKAAKALTDVISKKKKPVIFGGEQYIEYEDWLTVARFYGITVRADDAVPFELGGINGFKASARAFHFDKEISSAVAYCMRDEPNWEKKPIFQLASMSQTRACAKTLRNVLAWVVVLAGYKPTPAEEMDGVFNAAEKLRASVATQAEPGSDAGEDEVALQDYLYELCKKIGDKDGTEWQTILYNLTVNKEGKYGKTKTADIPLVAQKKGGGEWSPLKAIISKAEKMLEGAA